MPKLNIRVVKNASDLAAAAADAVIHAAREAIQVRGRFSIALSGGSTPEKAYELLAQPPRVAQLDWSRVHIIFGDERFVPLDDPRSNYGMAARTLLGHVPIPPSQILAVPTHLASANAAAQAYCHLVAGHFAMNPDGPPPRLDLILLGLGDDGHTASLFPGKSSLDEHRAWFIHSSPGVLPPPVDRITATFPLLNAGRLVIFLVAGEKKQDIVRAVLTDQSHKYPAARISPDDGKVLWLLDAAANGAVNHPGEPPSLGGQA